MVSQKALKGRIVIYLVSAKESGRVILVQKRSLFFVDGK
jgi:hypothetical protein